MASVDKLLHLAFADFGVELRAGVHAVGAHIVEFGVQVDYLLQAVLIFILLADVHHNQHCDADDVETVAAEKVEREETAPLGPSFEKPVVGAAIFVLSFSHVCRSAVR